MISSAIWDKLARVIFQRLTKFHEPVGLQIAREKSCDYLLIIHIQKLYTASGCQTKDVFSRLPFQIHC